MNAASGYLGSITNFLLGPFHTTASPRRVVGVVEACRIVLGLLLVHQTVDVLGFAFVMGPDTPLFGWSAVRTLVAAGCLTVGFLTPVAAVALVVQYGLCTLTFSLGDQLTVVVLWALVLMGAGGTASVDALLLGRWPALGRWLRLLAVDPNSTRGLAWARFSILLLYWGVCLVAMLFHLDDEFWWKGQVLSVALTGPYLSNFHDVFRQGLEASPSLFFLVCAMGLAVQVMWETLLLPLMYFRLGRWFVLAQGVMFFTISIVCMNLQYLPLIELVLWGLLFGTGWRLQPAAQTQPVGAPVFPRVFALTAVAAVVLHLGMYNYPFKVSNAFHHPRLYLRLQPFFCLLAQRPVCVFNRDDMIINDCWLVVHETDEAGRHLRIAPYLDVQGSRLSYMRNDLLYFVVSLRWHRAALASRFRDEDLTRPTDTTLDVAHKVALLDARLTGGTDRPRHYRVEVFRRHLDEQVSPPRWSDPEHVHSFPLRIEPTDLPRNRWPAYDLPPGHWGEDRHIQETEEWLACQPVRQEDRVNAAR
jgi:hypothetical protein